MKTYKVRDAAGRIWEVPQSAVFNDYVEAIMDMDGVEKDIAQDYVERQGEEALEIWWWEQVFPYASLVMNYGEIVEYISVEEKERIINSIAAKGYMEEVE